MKKRILLLSILCFGLTTIFCGDKNEKKIELKDVPKVVLDVVKAKVKDFTITKVEVENKKKYTEYEIEGTVKGKKIEVEVKVNKKGKVINIEVEDDDDEKEDD